MGLEAATYVSDLNSANPLGADQEKQGDDHIRLVKAALKATFLNTFAAGVYVPSPVTSAAQALAIATGKNFGAGFTLVNGELSASVAASALTIAVKSLAGSDPSATDPVYVVFRNATAATGDYTVLTLTAATSLVISSGSTLGTSNSVAFRLWIVLFNDAGTLRLGAVNCLSGTSIFALRQDILKSSTAEGGAGAADSAQIIYTGTAVASKALRIVGYMEWSAGLATAGTWSAVPTKIQMYGPDVALPGEVIQTVISETGTSSTGTTTIPYDNTIPQNTEGDQYFSQAITPTSAANLLEIEHQGFFSNSAVVNCVVALFQDAVANALRASAMTVDLTNSTRVFFMLHRMLAATASSTTFKIRAGGSSAGTTRINGAGGALFNGVGLSSLQIREIMA